MVYGKHRTETPLSRLQSFPFQALMIASNVQDGLAAARDANDIAEVRAILATIESHVHALVEAARTATTETKQQASEAGRASGPKRARMPP